MPKPGGPISIPLSENEAVQLLGRVKPTAEMPRQGAHPTKAAAKPKKKYRKITTRGMGGRGRSGR